MAINKNALIRYKTIDKCLQNRYRKWTLDDLIDACSDALYEYEGIDKGVSRRSVQADIQIMRSDKLGYNAPIIVVDRKYYTYEDADYSITNIPISEHDLQKLSESVELLKQFKGFSHFRELDSMVQKLEDHVYSQQTNQQPVIDFEKNDDLKGINYLDQLYQAIIQRSPLTIAYQSFKARQANSFDFHPYLLKEFRNRWFLIGKRQGTAGLMNLALDRMISIEKSSIKFKPDLDFDAQSYFKHVIGVSVSPTVEPEEVVLFVTHKHAPYVVTKPFHWSQKVIAQDHYGVTISLNVQHNLELEKEILGLGDGIKVVSPARLKRNIQNRLNGGIDLYKTEMSKKSLAGQLAKLEHRGYAVLNHIYTQREINKISSCFNRYFTENKPSEKGVISIRRLLAEIPELVPHLFNKNLRLLLNRIDPEAFLVKSMFFQKAQQSNWYVTMHQDVPINVSKKKEVKGYSSWTDRDGVTSVCPPVEISKSIFAIRIHLDDTDEKNGALKIIPGSHKKRLSDEEIAVIRENSIPTVCDVNAGGVQLMKPLLLHASSKATVQKKRRVIHLEFSSSDLSKGLEWEEKMALPMFE